LAGYYDITHDPIYTQPSEVGPRKGTLGGRASSHSYRASLKSLTPPDLLRACLLRTFQSTRVRSGKRRSIACGIKAWGQGLGAPKTAGCPHLTIPDPVLRQCNCPRIPSKWLLAVSSLLGPDTTVAATLGYTVVVPCNRSGHSSIRHAWALGGSGWQPGLAPKDADMLLPHTRLLLAYHLLTPLLHTHSSLTTSRFGSSSQSSPLVVSSWSQERISSSSLSSPNFQPPRYQRHSGGRYPRRTRRASQRFHFSSSGSFSLLFPVPHAPSLRQPGPHK
jgi:hypothetical protein